MAAAATVDRSGQLRASVVPWLGVLLLMMLSLNTLGGWVRLSGSGIAIPQWPLIHGSLLPPLGSQAWSEVRADWEQHQAALRRKVESGELAEGNLGREPQDDADFKLMFLTEYAHRLLAALTAVVLAGCLSVVLRTRELRAQAGVPLVAASVLVLQQAVLGGLLVDQGTGTHFLFLHQGNAGLVLLCILWALLRLLEEPFEKPAGEVPPALRRLLGLTVLAGWIQLLVGALIAGSHFAPPGSTSLLDAAELHQWLHRVGAGLLVVLLLLSCWQAWRCASGARLRLALQVAATFIAVQIVLGIGAALVAGAGGGSALPLAHQLMGMCLFSSLALAYYDACRQARQPAGRLPERELGSTWMQESTP